MSSAGIGEEELGYGGGENAFSGATSHGRASAKLRPGKCANVLPLVGSCD